jgi:hypothetical protein
LRGGARCYGRQANQEQGGGAAVRQLETRTQTKPNEMKYILYQILAIAMILHQSIESVVFGFILAIMTLFF